MKTYDNSWIRVAGHAQRIRDAEMHPWRCFINREPPELPLRHWQVTGEITPANCVPGTSQQKNNCGVIAWIDFYGSITIDDQNQAQITLKTH